MQPEYVEWPKALYKRGTAFEWEGVTLDELIVCDGASEIAARRNGWTDAVDAVKPAPAPVAKAPARKKGA